MLYSLWPGTALSWRIVSQLEHSLSLMDHVPFQGQEDLALGATVGGHGRPVRPTTVRA